MTELQIVTLVVTSCLWLHGSLKLIDNDSKIAGSADLTCMYLDVLISVSQ